MRTTAFLLVIVAIALPAFAAERQLSPDLRQAVVASLQNERQAASRYEAYAAKAETEGYLGAASLFRACAKAERIHANRFKAALVKYHAEVPNEPPYIPTVSTTEENIRAAIIGEQVERDTTYREATAAAKAEKNEEIARIFDSTRDTETEHANLLGNASRSLDSMKKAKSYFVCGECGYTTDVRLPLCPSCRQTHQLLEVKP